MESFVFVPSSSSRALHLLVVASIYLKQQRLADIDI